MLRRRRAGHDVGDSGFRSGLMWVSFLPDSFFRSRRRGDVLVTAGNDFLVFEIVIADTADVVMRRFHVRVGNNGQIDIATLLYVGDRLALFVQQESRNGNRQAGNDFAGHFLHGFFFDQAQDGQRHRVGAANVTLTRATRADDLAGFAQ